MCTRLSQRCSGLESAVFVTARTRKLLDSSLINLLFPTPQFHFLAAKRRSLSLVVGSSTIESIVATCLDKFTSLTTSSPCVLCYRPTPRTVAIRMRKSLMFDQSCADIRSKSMTRNEESSTCMERYSSIDRASLKLRKSGHARIV